MKTKTKNRAGFTLLEILLVVAAIAILAGIVIIAINPTKQLGDTRNAQRSMDVNTILNAAYQYALDHNGTFTGTIVEGACDSTVTTKMICKAGRTGDCPDGVVLSELTAAERYLVTLPTDPQNILTNGTGYYMTKSANGRLTVCAPNAENKTISVTR